ncbi:MAG: nuclear transport factor 2 family protein [Georgfuchsia sp.]
MDDIGRLIAIEEIRKVKARYFRGLDEKNETLLRETFADDVELDYRGSTTDPATGYNASQGVTEAIQRGGDHCAKLIANSLIGIVSVHHGSIGEIEITGEDTASAIWPMVDRLRFGPNSPIAEMIGYGHYHETYVRIDGKWRIKTLRLTRLRLDVISA